MVSKTNSSLRADHSNIEYLLRERETTVQGRNNGVRARSANQLLEGVVDANKSIASGRITHALDLMLVDLEIPNVVVRPEELPSFFARKDEFFYESDERTMGSTMLLSRSYVRVRFELTRWLYIALAKRRNRVNQAFECVSSYSSRTQERIAMARHGPCLPCADRRCSP